MAWWRSWSGQRTPRARGRDIASAALGEISDVWKVDHTRVVARDDGFDWWPEDFKVSVTAIRRTDGHVPETWMLSIRTDFLKDIPIDDARFLKFAGLNSGVFGSTYAWVFVPEVAWDHYRTRGATPRLWFANTAYLTADNASWLPGFLAHMSVLQPINARLASQAQGLLFGGTPDTSTSRLLGRSNQSDVLSQSLAAIADSGSSVNRWIGTNEFEVLASNWRRLPGSVCHGNDYSFDLQVPLDGDLPGAIRLSTDEVHVQMGNGLLGNLRLPIFDDLKSTAERCAAWNLTDTMWNDIPQFGCWYPLVLEHDEACPQFSTFIPNALYGNGIASLTVDWLYQKLRAVMYKEFPTPV